MRFIEFHAHGQPPRGLRTLHAGKLFATGLATATLLTLGGGAACDGMVIEDDRAGPLPTASEPAERAAALGIEHPYELAPIPSERLLWRCVPRGASCARTACCGDAICMHLPGPAGGAQGPVCVDSSAWRAWPDLWWSHR